MAAGALPYVSNVGSVPFKLWRRSSDAPDEPIELLGAQLNNLAYLYI